jgi:uncharacterized protein
MLCPRCKSSLIVLEYEGIELDWCPSCEGLWFDRGEMELIATHSGVEYSALGFDSQASTTERTLKCPLCRKSMDKRILGQREPVVADICPACGGLWLDHGELEHLLGSAGEETGDSGPVVTHLRGTFAAAPDGHVTPPERNTGDVRK